LIVEKIYRIALQKQQIQVAAGMDRGTQPACRK